MPLHILLLSPTLRWWALGGLVNKAICCRPDKCYLRLWDEGMSSGQTKTLSYVPFVRTFVKLFVRKYSEENEDFCFKTNIRVRAEYSLFAELGIEV